MQWRWPGVREAGKYLLELVEDEHQRELRQVVRTHGEEIVEVGRQRNRGHAYLRKQRVVRLVGLTTRERLHKRIQSRVAANPAVGFTALRENGLQIVGEHGVIDGFLEPRTEERRDIAELLHGAWKWLEHRTLAVVGDREIAVFAQQVPQRRIVRETKLVAGPFHGTGFEGRTREDTFECLDLDSFDRMKAQAHADREPAQRSETGLHARVQERCLAGPRRGVEQRQP